MKHHAHMGELVVVTCEGRRLRFKQKGTAKSYGAKPNPAIRREGPRLLAARFLVGFNVGGKPKWKLDDLIEVVTDYHKGGMSFVAQKGVWAPLDGPRDEEDSAQVIIMNDAGVDKTPFVDGMVTLGETIASRLQQSEVFLDIQERGIVTDSFTVTSAGAVPAEGAASP
jgi:hypothetical protein